jgi:hypothetical protein
MRLEAINLSYDRTYWLSTATLHINDRFNGDVSAMKKTAFAN